MVTIYLGKMSEWYLDIEFSVDADPYRNPRTVNLRGTLHDCAQYAQAVADVWIAEGMTIRWNLDALT